jgi:gliding motility-associated-like protein/uncharacterized repeat protein (TIGR01451 family)
MRLSGTGQAYANCYLSMLLFFTIACLFLFPCGALGQTKVLSIIRGESITVNTNITTTAVAYQWYKDGQPIAGAIFPSLTITQAGKYTVRAFNVQGCSSDPSSDVQVHVLDQNTDMMVTKQSESRDVQVGEPFEYLLTVVNNGPLRASGVSLRDALPDNLEYVSIKSVSAGNANYDVNSRVLTWDIGDVAVNDILKLSLVVKATDDGPVTNTAVVSATVGVDPNLANNSSSDTKVIKGLHVPNVFTPNGDGRNDTFVIPDLTNYEENEIVIINRWGNVIYQKKNYQNDWTGEGLNEGTYFYLLKVKSKKGNWDTYKGYITLLRSKRN